MGHDAAMRIGDDAGGLAAADGSEPRVATQPSPEPGRNAQSSGARRSLAELDRGETARVVGVELAGGELVDGDSAAAGGSAAALVDRLQAAGLWPGAEVQCLARAPFLFRLHGYRLALRRVEARAVTVESPA